MRRSRPLILSTLATTALALLAAGCGGGSSPGVANLNSSTTSTSTSTSDGPPTEAQLQQEQRDAVRFVHCMRSHGVANIPDPTVSPRGFKNAFSNPTSAFQSAYTTCGHLLPAGHARNQSTPNTQAQTVALLAFARCLRSHGFPSFPDPTAHGELSREMLARAGIDLHETAVVRAADTCTSVTHGVITRAVVARFVAGH
jgi:hypothetical protein